MLTVGSGEVGQGVVALFLCHDICHDADVVGERCNAQPFDHDVRQVVWVQHEMLPRVAEQLLVVFLLILPYMFD